ncbi:MAG: sugar ABC transporter substrate-binding protein [Thalassovita sp.]
MKSLIKAALVGATILGGAVQAQAQTPEEPFRAGYIQALEGKKVAFLPGAMAMDLAVGWLAGLKNELEPQGIEITVRDPNFSVQAGAQALTQLIAEKPDVIVVHNPDVTTYARLIKQAEKAGILIVQVNMSSLTPSTAYVGVDWVEMGAIQARHVAKACGGKGKIAIVQGDLAAAASAYTMTGIQSVLDENPGLEVVSNQSASWQSDKAKAITQTVLKQHSDLCGVIGFWDNMDTGSAAAVAEAGMQDQVYLATSGGGETRAACDMVNSGAYDLNVVYNVPNQGANLASTIKFLLSAGIKPGQMSGQMYTTLTPVTAANAKDEGVCWTMKQ